MLYKEKTLRRRSFTSAVVITLIGMLLLGMNAFSSLQSRISEVILPNVAAELSNLGFSTQNEFEFLRFTALHQDSLDSNFRAEAGLDDNRQDCLDQITTDPKSLNFSNRPQSMNTGSQQGGLLLGNDDLSQYTDKELKILCIALTTGPANSQSLRLTNDNSKISSLFYFLPYKKNYFYIYNVEAESDQFPFYHPSYLLSVIDKFAHSSSNPYWISEQYTDPQTKQDTISLVKNITDFQGHIVGFFVRDLYTQYLSNLIEQSMARSENEANIFDYSNIEFLIDQRTIYTHMSHVNPTMFQQLTFTNKHLALQNASDFGQLSIRISMPIFFVIKLLINLYPTLLLWPLFLFIFGYISTLQLLRGLREGDKQYFDSLTQTYNRNGLNNKVYKKIEKAVANNKDVHIFSIDANKFKQINDKYGHDMGDKAIELIAIALRHICKDDDDIIRLGGDEFLMALYIPRNVEFDSEQFMERVNQKITYDCKARSIPYFSVSAGYITFDLNSQQSLRQTLKMADAILLNKKSIDKIETICEEFDSFGINLSDEEVELKLAMNSRMQYITAEHLLQDELNEQVLSVYHGKLNYLISNYFKMMYSCNRTNDSLHDHRMKIIESHHLAGVPMSVFYFLFIKYSHFLFRDMDLSDAEIMVNNRVLSYEVHFISSLKAR
ncbi:GGDEF domain-containing protein [Vibrio sp. S17_S38]|uniref:GGDEF domain-containing protein n=1 Tax=Vibrio sp. S17_S38 TaxID=2720229 RepID=UPI0016802CCB|nr:GGDEF domain-containing protein [Vibrio sp. S17_S38]MBD1573334.1 GGDEF domain-containing protein [Vibrio sp. S17_S38]